MVIIPIERGSAPYMCSSGRNSMCVRDRETQRGEGHVVYAQDSHHMVVPEV